MDRAALAVHLRSEVQLKQQLEREYLPTGIAAYDARLGGIPRGTITEVFGPSSSGKTTLLHAMIANASAAGEFCALVDASDAFDPESAAGAGTDLQRLLWVRCSGLEPAIRSVDLLVHSGGWGLVILDLADIRADLLRKLPSSYWYRFKRAVENTPTAFVLLQKEPQARNCAGMMLEMPRAKPVWSGAHQDFRLLTGFDVRVTPRKPMHAAQAAFLAKALA